MEEQQDVIISAQISSALNRELEKIAEETGRFKSDLIREACTSFVGMYRNAERKA